MMLGRRRFLTGIGASTASLWLGCQSSPARSSKSAHVRDVDQVVAAQPSRDGAGVALRRSLGSRALPVLDPFLLLDEIHSADAADYMAGFPRHPHRGFETVSYVLKGGFAHRDSVGNHGLIADGGAQWMTAGRGIVHEEMPKPTTGPELWGLQLWVNLPAAHKMIRPRYQDLGAAAIPELDVADARVRLVAGQIGQTVGAVDGIDVAPTMLDATLPEGASFRHDLPGDDNAFAYVLDGTVVFGPRAVDVSAGQLAVFGAGTTITAAGRGRFLLIAGTPIREPVARRGPFVMNTDAELRQAFEDYRSGRLTDPST
jgi:redox-sensitive bicupin YhaK (pirin superfamily)